MACGCPVVSTASSDAVRDLLETMGARAPVPVGDPAALAAALDQALDGRLPAVSGHAMLAYGIQTACDAHATFFAGLMQHASAPDADAPIMSQRSEEHTSELQSLMRISYAVFCLTKK